MTESASTTGKFDVYFDLTESPEYGYLVWFPEENYNRLRDNPRYSFYYSTEPDESVKESLERMQDEILELMDMESYEDALRRAS
ncbi:MAG: hypothetical protein U0136_06660 [Bdellovibrionota bacterium]